MYLIVTLYVMSMEEEIQLVLVRHTFKKVVSGPNYEVFVHSNTIVRWKNKAGRNNATMHF